MGSMPIFQTMKAGSLEEAKIPCPLRGKEVVLGPPVPFPPFSGEGSPPGYQLKKGNDTTRFLSSALLPFFGGGFPY